MTRTLRLAALALSFAAAGSAFADDITLDTLPHESRATRAEVQQDLTQFKRAGVNFWSTSYNPVARAASTTVRGDIVRDVVAANRQHQLTVMTGEDSGSEYLSRRGDRAPSDGALRLAARVER